MRTIGLIGGTSWHSTMDYYRIINETVHTRKGDHSSAKILLYSVDFQEIVILTQQQDWNGVAKILCEAAKRLETAGADCLLLCANTMHVNAEKVQMAINIPLIHVADVTVKAIMAQSVRSVLLLGTRYTMQADFYKERLLHHGIECYIPLGEELEIINDAIYNELGKGIFLPKTKDAFLGIIGRFIPSGIEGVILGCTEIPLLIRQEDCTLYLFDTTRLHAIAAVDFAGW